MSEYERLPYDEIVRLTGKTQHAAQLRSLRRMGVRAYRLDNGKGPVCVLKCWLVARDAQPAKSKPVLKSDRELMVEGR